MHARHGPNANPSLKKPAWQGRQTPTLRLFLSSCSPGGHEEMFHEVVVVVDVVEVVFVVVVVLVLVSVVVVEPFHVVVVEKLSVLVVRVVFHHSVVVVVVFSSHVELPLSFEVLPTSDVQLSLLSMCCEGTSFVASTKSTPTLMRMKKIPRQGLRRRYCWPQRGSMAAV